MICAILFLFVIFFITMDGGIREVYAKEVAEEGGEGAAEDVSPGTLYAKSAVLMDGNSGRVLYEKEGNVFLSNASTTKILTCILALENGNMDDIVKISSYAASMPDVQLNVMEGETYYLKDLLHSLMLESHNDVAVAIAEHIAGSQEKFSVIMNQKAKEIGCKNTFFLTPNGLDATAEIKGETETEVSHGTTAEDLALIMRYCIKISPQKDAFLKITQTESHTFTNIEGNRSFSCRNHNIFLNMMEGAISGKTGFTGKAGYCYVGALERDGKVYIVSLLACGWPGNKSYKWADCRKLMEYGLEYYKNFDINDLEKEYKKELSAKVKNGKGDKIGQEAEVILKRTKHPFPYILLREGEKIEIKIKKKELAAPVQNGQNAGSIEYYIDGKKWIEEELYCQGQIEKINF